MSPSGIQLFGQSRKWLFEDQNLRPSSTLWHKGYQWFLSSYMVLRWGLLATSISRHWKNGTNAVSAKSRIQNGQNDKTAFSPRESAAFKLFLHSVALFEQAISFTCWHNEDITRETKEKIQSCVEASLKSNIPTNLDNFLPVFAHNWKGTLGVELQILKSRYCEHLRLLHK